MSQARMTVEVHCPIYEINGDEPKGGDPQIVVRSHPIKTNSMLVIYVDGTDYAVAADAMRLAIRCAKIAEAYAQSCKDESAVSSQAEDRFGEVVARDIAMAIRAASPF